MIGAILGALGGLAFAALLYAVMAWTHWIGRHHD